MESLCRRNCVQLTSVVLCGSVDGTTDNHEEAAEDDAGLATPSISDCRHCEHGEDGADGKHIGQEAEEIRLVGVRSNVIKVTLPVVVLLQEVEE